MADKMDDLEAVRNMVEALKGFNAEDQERIIRWTREKLGLAVPQQGFKVDQPAQTNKNTGDGGKPEKPVDIKTFVSEKNPSSARQFAATVAYYYRFVAPEEQKKDSITPEDLQEACRQVSRQRLHNPGQTLINAHHAGILDKGSGRGSYSINTVGENLVAMTLPGGAQTTEIKRGKKSTNKQSKKSTKKRT